MKLNAVVSATFPVYSCVDFCCDVLCITVEECKKYDYCSAVEIQSVSIKCTDSYRLIRLLELIRDRLIQAYQRQYLQIIQNKPHVVMYLET